MRKKITSQARTQASPISRWRKIRKMKMRKMLLKIVTKMMRKMLWRCKKI